MRKLRELAVCIAAFGLSAVQATAVAYEINPLEDKYKYDGANAELRWIADAVHEELTLRARACAMATPAGPPEALRCPTSEAAPPGNPHGHKHDSLVRGVWWNDDPNQLLFAFHEAKWLAWMKDGETIAKNGHNLRGVKTKITKDYYMNYRSHYGDLQFLHAMASADDVDPKTTQQNILTWAEFAYSVAIGKFDPELPLGRVESSGFNQFFRHRPGWSVSYLFGPRYVLKDRDHIPQMALGSLLHVVQDSYSEAHAKRVFLESPKCKSGRVLRFNSYVNQAVNRHRATDIHSAWSAQSFGDAQGPVEVSAAIFKLVQSRAQWPAVRDYLEHHVFCLDDDAELSSDGGFGETNLLTKEP
jgi:hypothetical protein